MVVGAGCGLRVRGGEGGGLTVLVSVVMVAEVMLRWTGGRVGEAGGSGLTVVLRVVRKGLPRLGLSGVSAAEPYPDSSPLVAGASPLLRREEVERRNGLSRSFTGDRREGVVGRLSDGLVGDGVGEPRSADGDWVSSLEPERRNGEARLEFANNGEGLYGLPGPGAVDCRQISKGAERSQGHRESYHDVGVVERKRSAEGCGGWLSQVAGAGRLGVAQWQSDDARELLMHGFVGGATEALAA